MVGETLPEDGASGYALQSKKAGAWERKLPIPVIPAFAGMTDE